MHNEVEDNNCEDGWLVMHGADEVAANRAAFLDESRNTVINTLWQCKPDKHNPSRPISWLTIVSDLDAFRNFAYLQNTY